MVAGDNFNPCLRLTIWWQVVAAAVVEYESLVTVYQDFGYDVVVIPQDTVAALADFSVNALAAA